MTSNDLGTEDKFIRLLGTLAVKHYFSTWNIVRLEMRCQSESDRRSGYVR